jgi:NAD(P)H-flavin reductase
LALLEQQILFSPGRDMALIWGMRRAEDFYAIATLQQWLLSAPNLRVWLASETGDSTSLRAERVTVTRGTVVDALNGTPTLVSGRDIYAAGPPMMLRQLVHNLTAQQVASERMHIDQFGI